MRCFSFLLRKCSLHRLVRGNVVVARASTLQSVTLGLIRSSSQIKDFENGVHNFPAWLSAGKGQREEKYSKFAVVFLNKALNGIPRL